LGSRCAGCGSGYALAMRRLHVGARLAVALAIFVLAVLAVRKKRPLGYSFIYLFIYLKSRKLFSTAQKK